MLKLLKQLNIEKTYNGRKMKEENYINIKLTDSTVFLYNYKKNVYVKILLLFLQALQPFCWAMASLSVY
jgi:hypothetical protein